MYEAAIWWATSEILALLTLPIAIHAFRNLPDKGYGFSKAFGILVLSYGFWLLSSIGALDNTRAAIIAAVIVVGLLAWGGFADGRREATRLWREERKYICAVELLFVLSFALWSFIRSLNPEIAGTEKPMEIAFLNSVLRSERFPPVDPWLAGYPISYYYFGYVMVALLAKLGAIPASIAFNLAIALLFALTVIGAFSLAYNLAAGRITSLARQAFSARALVCGIAAAVFVAVMGNLEGLLEVFYARGALGASFWSWLNIQNLNQPYMSTTWHPTEWFWWFRASRIIGDFDPITNVSRDYTINEFPFFSFLLGDLHPHVLSLPFTFLAMGLALSLIKKNEALKPDVLLERPVDFLLWGLIIGGLGFLNSWDLPTYLALSVLAFAVRKRQTTTGWIKQSLLFGLALLVLSVTLYWPFYLGFSSQVRGLGLVGQRTKLHHFFIFWGPLLMWAAGFLMARLGRTSTYARENWPGAESPTLSRSNRLPVRHLMFVAATALALSASLLLQATVSIILLIVAYTAFHLLANSIRREDAGEEIFVISLTFLAVLLLLTCELVFVRDFFGNRMNTVFKVYYQVWQMLAIVAAYTLYSLFFERGRTENRRPFEPRPAVSHRLLSIGSYGSFVLAILLTIGALAYPIMATFGRASEGSGALTLDGTAFLAQANNVDYAAINWLNRAITGTPVILEAPGPSYSQFGRIAAFTGLPTVVGWDGHELQWRGSGEEAARRKADVDAIYQAGDKQLTLSLLRKYNVTYVYIGRLEQEKYGSAGALSKFSELGDIVYKDDGVTIYKLRNGRDET